MLFRYSREPFERMSRPFGLMNTQTTFTRRLRRTPDLEGFWFDDRTLFAETSFLSGSAYHDRTVPICGSARATK